MKKLTPAQQQYANLKEQHTDALLFFRMGDFYELFYDDAKRAHSILGITLTARDKSGKNPIPMAGIPYHSLDKYTPKLLAAGFKIAIAEQVGQVEKGKIVHREVTHVLTPGTTLGEAIDANYIMAVCYTDSYIVARGDVSLGNYSTRVCKNFIDLIEQIDHIEPSELIVDISFPELDAIKNAMSTKNILTVCFDIPHQPMQYLTHVLGVQNLDGYGQSLAGSKPFAVALLFSYVEHMQQRKVQPVHSIGSITLEQQVLFDDITRDNLEVFSSRYNGSRKHSLYDVINMTSTPMGSRLLHDRLGHPISNMEILNERLGYIQRYLDNVGLRKQVREYLDQVPDMHRLSTRIIAKPPSSASLQNLLYILKELYTGRYSAIIQEELCYIGCPKKSYDMLEKTFHTLHKGITLEPLDPTSISILPSYDTDIDKYRHLLDTADTIFLDYQQDLAIHASGVKVKLKWIKNQGYLLEVTPKDIEKFETYRLEEDQKFNFIRTQTLKTGQRYVTPYLQTIALQIEQAQDLLRAREQEILQGFVDIVEYSIHACIDVCNTLASLDVSVSCAMLLEQKQRCIPEFHEGKEIEIVAGRHPVVEHFLPQHESFIPNDLFTNASEYMHLITGPNMGGKSTYLRQQSLILLLAHAGLPVPATKAKLPIVDALFARIGAGDALAKNQSTFMTEMLETANIIHNATERSFVILDELGRGTSTFDGMSLAKAIVVYLCQEKKVTTLFATHYHELTDLEGSLEGMKNYHVSVYENQQDVVFLKKVIPGRANKSYGLDVAKLAGIPQQIISAAGNYLKELELKENSGGLFIPHQSGFDFGPIDDMYRSTYDAIKQLLGKKHVHDITPIESLLILQEISIFFDE